MRRDRPAARPRASRWCWCRPAPSRSGAATWACSPSQRQLEEQQAAAAAGQILLAHAYQEILHSLGVTVAQVLLTLDDTESRRRYLNAPQHAADAARLGVVPVMNENDTVATQEMRYGDNDRLAARVAQMVSADCLVLLSDVDGLYTPTRPTTRGATLIPEVTRDHAGDRRDGRRLRARATAPAACSRRSIAARIAMGAGCAMCIASGKRLRPLSGHRGGKAHVVRQRGARRGGAQAVDRGHAEAARAARVDAGAEQALAAGRSLLPVGVVAVDGQFERGDAVTVRSGQGRELARGLVAYASDEARRIQGGAARTSSSSWAIVAAMRSFTATTSLC